MSEPLPMDLVGDRGVAFNTVIVQLGVDWTGAAMRSQIRLYPDAPGSPLFSLTSGAGIFLTYGGTATIGTHIAAGRLTTEVYDYVSPWTGTEYAASDLLAMSVLALGVSASAMKGPPDGPVPFPPERGDDWVGSWDFLVDADGAGVANETKQYFGQVRVRGSSTQ